MEGDTAMTAISGRNFNFHVVDKHAQAISIASGEMSIID
jgi:hypothetical protein